MGNRVRVDLYIDSGSAEGNKALFDWLELRKDAIEQQFGNPLDWERLDDKRASRIAIYRTGSINDAEPEIDAIRKWTVEHLLHFKQVFNPYLHEFKDS